MPVSYTHLDVYKRQIYYFIHIGTELYSFTIAQNKSILLSDLLLSGLANKKSRGFTFGGALYILGAGSVSYTHLYIFV